MNAHAAKAGFMRAYGWPCLVAAGAALLVQGAVALFLEPVLASEAEALAYMSAEVAEVERGAEDVRVSREAVAAAVACRSLSATLLADRNFPTLLLGELAQVRADGIRFTTLDQYGGIVDLKGEARSYLAISELVDRTDGSAVLERPSLRSVGPSSAGSEGYRLTFDLRMRIRGRPEGTQPAPLGVQDPR